MKQFTIFNQLTAMPNRLAMVLTVLFTLGVGSAWGEETTATLSFANKAQRTSFSTTKQVWEQNGVTFTNNKSSSKNNVADYAYPVHLYANSSVTVACSLGKMTKIVFDCNTASYATAMKNSIGTVSGVNVTVSSDKVTVTFTTAVESFVAKLTAQVRLDSITVTYEAEYNITYTGDDYITYSGTKPETIKKEDSGFELEFSVNDGYKLNNVQVKMGGQDLVLDEDYLWEEGYLLILPETDITGDIEIIFETVATCTAPTINTQPVSATYTTGAAATALKVVASGTNLTYQWYSNTSNSTSGATKINDATNSTYKPSTSTAGTKYYYCIVSSGSCSATSKIVSVVISPTYTVTYNANGATSGSVPTDATSYTSGATVTVKGNSGNLAKTGYTFAGWNTKADGTGTTYAAGTGTFTISSNTTLYAKWTANTYTVTWIVDGVTKRTDTGVAYNTSKTAPTVSPIPCGDVIAGWTDAIDGNYEHGTSTLHSGATPSITITSDKTFHAVFADYEQ